MTRSRNRRLAATHFAGAALAGDPLVPVVSEDTLWVTDFTNSLLWQVDL